MKPKDKYIITILLIIITLTLFANAFADDYELVTPLEDKIKVYYQLLAEAKKAGVDTSEAEMLMKDAEMTLAAGFASSASTMVGVANTRLLEGLANAGWTKDDLEDMLTPSEEFIMENTPTPPPAATTPVTNMYNTDLNSEPGNKLGGSSLLMAEKVLLSWIKPEGLADLSWDIIEEKEGNYNWEKTDRFYSQIYQHNLNPVINITGIPLWDYGKEEPYNKNILHKLPNNLEEYKKFIRLAVERYDGDGSNDGGSSIKIKYFQLGNEISSPESCYGQSQWTESVENYALLVRETKIAMTNSNPDTRLILTGSSSLEAWGKEGELNPVTKEPFMEDGWFVKFFEALQTMEEQEQNSDGISEYFDSVDFHHYGGTIDPDVNIKLTYKPLSYGIDLIKKRLYEYGYKNTSIWVTGNSIYTGTPVAYSNSNDMTYYREVSEREQAIYLVKSLILPLSRGVTGIFWSTFIDKAPGEGVDYGTKDTFYSYSGLINWDQTPKLSFHTYKLLSELLDKAKFNQQFTGLEEDVYGYAFIKENKPFYIFWNDSSESKKVKIQVEQGKTYTITSMITNLEGEITETSIRADGGLLIFELNDEPVIVKQK